MLGAAVSNSMSDRKVLSWCLQLIPLQARPGCLLQYWLPHPSLPHPVLLLVSLAVAPLSSRLCLSVSKASHRILRYRSQLHTVRYFVHDLGLVPGTVIKVQVAVLAQ